MEATGGGGLVNGIGAVLTVSEPDDGGGLTAIGWFVAGNAATTSVQVAVICESP
jgi:hypothetical protein